MDFFLYSVKTLDVMMLKLWWCYAQFTGVMVQFSNRFQGAVKEERDDRSNGALDQRQEKTRTCVAFRFQLNMSNCNLSLLVEVKTLYRNYG